MEGCGGASRDWLQGQLGKGLEIGVSTELRISMGLCLSGASLLFPL